MKKIISAILVLALSCSTMALAGCGSGVQGISSEAAAPKKAAVVSSGTAEDLSGKLTLNGSTSMEKVCNALGEAFMEKYPNVKVEKSGTGSGDAPKAVLSGTALIGDLSRNMKDEEKPENYEIMPIAIDGIAVAVNKNNKMTALTSNQITKIFTGEIKNWKEVGGTDQAITVFGREAASGTRDGFESIFGCKEKCKYAAEVTSTGEVVQKVSSDSSGIGYVSMDSVNDSIVACKIDGVDPTKENIVNKTYKAQRPFIEIYKKGSDSELIKAWFDFIKSNKGQKTIEDVGLVVAQ